MRTSLVLLVSVVASATAMPLRDTLNAGSFPRNKDVPPASAKTEPVAAEDGTNRPAKKQSEKTDGGTKDRRTTPLTSIPSQDDRADTKQDAARSQKLPNEGKDKTAKKNRKHKAIFVNYPVVSELRYADVPYDIDYTGNGFDADERSAADADGYQESNIFYIRLPPTPYMFVPGLGYISQPPTYSTSNLHPQIPFARPKPVYRQPVDPFIKLPIDFVSNGKPTSVYQWQRKPAKKPSDTPITNLDSLSAEFVSNGKPTSIYQWQSNARPIKRPDDLVHNMDKGPYSFNGKPTSFFLLKSDGTSSAQQSLRYSDYQQDNSYY